jgi:uncharacterized membrane protein YphA (DoxX/SURF4 family)
MTTMIAIDPALQLALRCALALLFASAALHKLRDMARFRSAVDSYALLPQRIAAVAATCFPLLELMLAVSIASGISLPAAALTSSVLLSTYAAAIGVNIRRGRTAIDCGCSGPAANVPLQPALVVRNLMVASIAVLLIAPATDRPLTALDMAGVAFTTTALAASWQASERLLALGPRAAAMRARHRGLR